MVLKHVSDYISVPCLKSSYGFLLQLGSSPKLLGRLQGLEQSGPRPPLWPPRLSFPCSLCSSPATQAFFPFLSLPQGLLSSYSLLLSTPVNQILCLIYSYFSLIAHHKCHFLKQAFQDLHYICL